MRVYENQIVECDFPPLSVLPIWPFQLRRTLADIEYRKCAIRSVVHSHNRRCRPVLRNLRLFDCLANYVKLYGAVVEDVLVEQLRTGETLWARASVFKHVTLRGKIGKIVIREQMDALEGDDGRNNRYYWKANAAYYGSVDWALDISEAEFREVELHGVPGHLVRRDPATQVLVTREKALQGTWRKLDLSDTHWPISIGAFLQSDLTSIVLAAPKRDRDFPKLLDGLKQLRDAGVAEPD